MIINLMTVEWSLLAIDATIQARTPRGQGKKINEKAIAKTKPMIIIWWMSVPFMHDNGQKSGNSSEMAQ